MLQPGSLLSRTLALVLLGVALLGAYRLIAAPLLTAYQDGETSIEQAKELLQRYEALAREIAREVPHAVRQVITLGSPFAAEPESTHAGWLYRLLSGSEPAPSRRQLRDLRRPLPVPSTSIFSKSDGIVPWQGCLQKEGALAENIEVPGVSHLGMGTHRAVLALVAERLAQPEGRWTPLRRR